ncbi:MAG: SUMF1/EgtB/PvdO family nonheme iron enzyme [Phormidesmis sp. CAN_BIN44]|nr:SUMF1/EgtB/PvdO family nonheme iron enzyme [Phormidesmis sp. CAN_BIN44]
MLDGLDEVADESQRRRVSGWVDRQMQTYPKTAFILTSRPFGYRSAPLNQVGTVLEVKPFSLNQMRQFVENWYLQNEIMKQAGKDNPGVRVEARKQAEDLVDRIQNTPALATMAINPLLLTMILAVHYSRKALPGRRVDLYSEICDVLLGRRQDAKGISDSLTVMQKKAVLQVLALGLMQRKTREFTPSMGIQIIQEKFSSVVGSGERAGQFLRHIENTTGLLVNREEGIYEFAHKSFQEYLAAVEVRESSQEALLIEKIHEVWWDETIRLYAAQTDSTNLVRAAATLQPPNIVALTLAHDCLEEGLSIQPEVRQELESLLETGLESPDPQLFHLAAEVKLSRRMNRLLRLDEKTDIDTSLITCAEYQLFIDDKRNKGENRQPDHWQDYRFLPGDAAQPIAGVRASDAEEFCQWLADRSPTQTQYQYRLPTSVEAETYSINPQNVGYWCSIGDSKAVVGIAAQQWAIWLESLSDTRNLDLQSYIESYRYLARERELELVRNSERELELVRNSERELERARNSTRKIERALERDLKINRELERELEREFISYNPCLERGR